MRGPRPLDHLVLPCRDLAAAAGDLMAAGFTVGRRNRHPWGTENHIVQLPGVFLEPIALAPDRLPLHPADDAFPFAGFLAGQGASRTPSGMVVLRSEDARADAAAFAAAGIGEGRTLHFAREGAAPDGSLHTVAFTLAFATQAAMPDVGFFVCEQHFPERFWNGAMQRHPNGVTGIAEVVLGAPDPALAAAFLARFAAQPAVTRDGDALRLALADGTTLVVEPGPSALRSVAFRGGSGPPRRIGDVRLRFGVA